MAAVVTPRCPRNWSKLDAAHKRRSELVTVVFDPDGSAFSPPAKAGWRGRGQHFRDELIEGAADGQDGAGLVTTGA